MNILSNMQESTIHHLSTIIQEPIDDDHGWASYGEFKVIIRNKDGFINATKLCALYKDPKDPNKNKKRFESWLANEKSKELIAYVSALIDSRMNVLEDEEDKDEISTRLTRNLVGIVNDTTQPIRNYSAIDIKDTGSSNTLRGTYVHPLLAPHIASWVSAEFAIKVSQIVNNYIVRDYKEQLRAAKQDIQEKQDNITTLIQEVASLKSLAEKQSAKLDKQSSEMKKQSEKLDKQSEQIDKQLEGTDRLEKNLGVANENIVCTLRTLGRVSNRMVPLHRVVPTKRECFTVLNYNDPSLLVPYYVIRGQEPYTQARISQKKRQYPQLQVIVQLNDHPNTVELWNAVKARLGRDITFFANTNTFGLENIGEAEFVRIVQGCDMEKRREHQEMLDKLASESEELVEHVCEEEKEEPVREEEREEPAQEETVREEPIRVVTADSLLLLTMPKLKEMCRENGWKGWSKLRKLEIVEFILASSSS